MEVWDAGFVLGHAWLVHLDELHFSPAGPGSICPTDRAGLPDPESSLCLFLLRAQVHVSVSTVFRCVYAGRSWVCSCPCGPITEVLEIGVAAYWPGASRSEATDGACGVSKRLVARLREIRPS